MTVVKVEPPETPFKLRAHAKAYELRTYYEALVAVGFTPEQAWELLRGADWIEAILE